MANPSALITEPIGPVLWRQSLPTAVGIVFMILVNLIDTYWASKLGTDELAAMSFTFPIIGIVMNISIGLMIGTSVVIARTIGAGDEEKAKQISTRPHAWHAHRACGLRCRPADSGFALLCLGCAG